MLVKIKMEIEAENLNTNMGSLFHGYIMQKIDSAYAEYFHYNTTNPFTSCVYRDREDKKYYWRITTIINELMIISYFLNNEIKSIYIENKEMEVLVKSFSMEKTSFEELYLKDENKNKLNLITPTSFKSNGTTHIFPNIQTLLLGIITKINQHSDTVKIEDEKIINEFLEKVYIRDYNLRTQNFYLEKIKIKGFLGMLDLAIRGNDPVLTQLLSFLVSVSEYTGFGIKTSLGMGGIKVNQ